MSRGVRAAASGTVAMALLLGVIVTTVGPAGAERRHVPPRRRSPLCRVHSRQPACEHPVLPTTQGRQLEQTRDCGRLGPAQSDESVAASASDDCGVALSPPTATGERPRSELVWSIHHPRRRLA
jgi:DNA-binding transcriptional regulator YdaS (Cro superfamily)